MKRKYEMATNGVTVWINGEDGLLGRFKADMIDVHVGGACVGDSCGRGTWEDFKVKMLTHHGIKVSDRYRPKDAKKEER